MTNDRRVAIVTGASRGLGEGIVNAYLGKGWRVVGTSRSIKRSDNPDYRTIAGDIGDPSTGQNVIADAIGRFGRVDTLVNNAGVFISSEFTKYTTRQYYELLKTNLDGFFFITQHAAKVMLEQGSGHIVQITTTIVDHALSAVPSVLASLTKGALSAATRSLAIEYATRGVRVNAVAPGMIRTPMHSPDSYEALASLHPVNRMGEVRDITQAIMYLESAEFVTGETLHVDGGQIAGH